MSIFKYDEINVKNIKYEKPEKKGMYYYSSISYDNKPLHLQSPKMKCNSSGKDILKNLNLDCESSDFGFYDFFLNIEDRNIKETFKKNKEWFGKEIPLELIDDMYKRTIKPIKKDTKPNFTFKIPSIKNKIQCHIYDQNKICIDINKIEPDCDVIFTLHIRGLKFLKQHYYCDCYISQMKIFLPKNEKYSTFGECVIEDDESVKEDVDIIDDDVLNEIIRKEETENEKEENRKNLELEISKLKTRLDNL